MAPFPCPFVLHPLSDAGFVHSCSFVQTFDTIDDSPFPPDGDYGQWYIYNDVNYTANAPGAPAFDAVGAALVTVIDPNYVPEPASFSLLSLGVVLAFLSAKRRHKFHKS